MVIPTSNLVDIIGVGVDACGILRSTNVSENGRKCDCIYAQLLKYNTANRHRREVNECNKTFRAS